MVITQEAMQAIRDGFLNASTELGGIMGSEDGITVSQIQFDRLDHPPAHPCSYTPNVDFLNICIDAWQKRGIQFMGIFHSHYGNSVSLSSADKRYICTIMQAMPEHIQRLYFPVYGLPDGALTVFFADRQGNIFREKLDLFQKPVL